MIWTVLLLALILRLININQSLWLDEGTQVIMSSKSLYYIIFERSGDFHPPLSYLLYHFWLMLGTSEIWLRILPVLFGVATIFIVYKICQKIFNEKISLISAFFLAIGPYHIYYSQEIRMYSLATFFAALSMYFFLTSKSLSYVLVSTALLYTHYMGIFLIIAQTIYFFIARKKEFLRYLKLLVGILLLFFPWIPQFYRQLISGTRTEEILLGWGSLLSLDPIKAVPLTFLKFSIGRIDFENVYLYGATSLTVLIFVSFLLIKSFIKETKLVWYWLTLPIIFTWLISFILPMNQPFRLLFVIPAFYILLAVGVSRLEKYERLGILVVLAISLLGLLVYWTNPRFQREDWRTATREIPNAIFAWPTPFDPYIWYGGKGVGVLSMNMDELRNQNDIYFFEYLQVLSDPNKNIQKWFLDNGYILEKTLNYNGVGFVYKYIK